MAIESRYRQTLVVKRLDPVMAGAETLGGLDTTLVSDAAAGADAIELVDVGAALPSDLLRIGDVGETEIAAIAAIAGTTVTLAEPLGRSHDSGDQVRALDAGPATSDEYGQPVTEPVTVATIAGLIQPRPLRDREVALTSQAGPAIGSHVGYIDPLAGLTTACWIEHAGTRYDIVAIPDAAGLGHHLELVLQAVT